MPHFLHALLTTALIIVIFYAGVGAFIVWSAFGLVMSGRITRERGIRMIAQCLLPWRWHEWWGKH